VVLSQKAKVTVVLKKQSRLTSWSRLSYFDVRRQAAVSHRQFRSWSGKEWLTQPGQIKRSTLQEKLAEQGYSARQMRMYADTGVAARRYQQKYRNQLVHSDIKYGPYLPIGKEGQKKQVYLVTFIDDATRFILHGEFYPLLDKIIVEDCFRKAISKIWCTRESIL